MATWSLAITQTITRSNNTASYTGNRLYQTEKRWRSMDFQKIYLVAFILHWYDWDNQICGWSNSSVLQYVHAEINDHNCVQMRSAFILSPSDKLFCLLSFSLSSSSLSSVAWDWQWENGRKMLDWYIYDHLLAIYRHTTRTYSLCRYVTILCLVVSCLSIAKSGRCTSQISPHKPCKARYLLMIIIIICEVVPRKLHAHILMGR